MYAIRSYYDVEDNSFDFLARFQYFVRIVDLASPGHVGNVNHTVDIIFDFNECAIAGHVSNFTVDLAANRIFFSEDFPRITFFLSYNFV